MALFHMILAATALAFEPEAPAELNPLMRRQDFTTASLLETDFKQPFQVQSMPVENPFRQMETFRQSTAPGQVPVLASQDLYLEQPTDETSSAEEASTTDNTSSTMSPREKAMQLLLNGCVIPQWRKDDYLCLEHPHVRAFRDYQGIFRKKLQDGENCTVSCPNLRFWQAPNILNLCCKEGELLTCQTGTAPVAIRCITSDYWWNILVAHVVMSPFLSLLLLYWCWMKCLSSFTRGPKGVTEQAPENRELADPAAEAAGEAAGPAEPAGAPAATAAAPAT